MQQYSNGAAKPAPGGACLLCFYACVCVCVCRIRPRLYVENRITPTKKKNADPKAKERSKNKTKTLTLLRTETDQDAHMCPAEQRTECGIGSEFLDNPPALPPSQQAHRARREGYKFSFCFCVPKKKKHKPLPQGTGSSLIFKFKSNPVWQPDEPAKGFVKCFLQFAPLPLQKTLVACFGTICTTIGHIKQLQGRRRRSERKLAFTLQQILQTTAAMATIGHGSVCHCFCTVFGNIWGKNIANNSQQGIVVRVKCTELCCKWLRRYSSYAVGDVWVWFDTAGKIDNLLF